MQSKNFVILDESSMWFDCLLYEPVRKQYISDCSIGPSQVNLFFHLSGVTSVFFLQGAFYSFGNMSTYMTSYMRQNGSPNITYTGRNVLYVSLSTLF